MLKVNKDQILEIKHFSNDYIKLFNETGSLSFVVGRPGTGKSSLMMKILKDGLELNSKIKALFVSLETSKDLLREKMNQYSVDVNSPQLLISDKSAINIEEIETIIKSDSDIKIVVIDYLQLVSANTTEKQENYIVNKLKTIKEELKINIVVASQLGRTLEIESHIKECADEIIWLES